MAGIPVRSTSSSNSSALAKYWARKGVTSNIDILDNFKFYQFDVIEFGNWVNQDIRLDSSLNIIDGCKDVLQPLFYTKNLGFDKSINIAIGSRGKKGSLAYFQPATLFLSFKLYESEELGIYNGVKSFIHEYFHALDYLIGRYIDVNTKYNYLSESWDDLTITTPIRLAVSDLLLNYYELQLKYNPLFLKGVKKKKYWQSPIECFARISEQCVCFYSNKHKIKQHITKPMTYYTEMPNVYMTKAVLAKVYPLWLKVIELFSAVMRGKSDNEVKKVAEKQNKVEIRQGTLFEKVPISKKKSSETKKKTTKTKKK